MRRQIQDEAVDILVGTQMLAKGHDFHNLTLVVRAEPGQCVVQQRFSRVRKTLRPARAGGGPRGTRRQAGRSAGANLLPEHPLFRALRAHDYDSWAATLLTEREQAGFPPFVFQVLLRAEGKQEAEVYEFMHQARSAAAGLAMQVEIYGVVAAALSRRANHLRVQLLVQSDTRKICSNFCVPGGRCWMRYRRKIYAGRWTLTAGVLKCSVKCQSEVPK